MSENGLITDALAAATKRRIELKEAVSDVERAIAAPTGKPEWRPNLLTELAGLKVALQQHIDEVEGDEGLLAELRFEVPRLANKIKRVGDEHPMLTEQVDATIELADSDAELDEVRTAVLDTLVAIVRHRQQGADLVYEGYSIDIGGG